MIKKILLYIPFHNFKNITSDIDIKSIPIVHLSSSFILLAHPKIEFANGVRFGTILYGYDISPHKLGNGPKDILRKIRNKYLKKYIWDNYKKLKDKEKEEIYKEANCLFDKKEPFIINTIYNKLTEVAESEKDLNIDGFFRFRMRDFMVYISIISDIAFEEYLIRKDKNQFINNWLTVQYQTLSKYKVPLFPVGIGIREGVEIDGKFEPSK